MKADVKITVLKRMLIQEFIDEYAAFPWQPCQRFREGQEFVVSGETINIPEGFCSWAWADIQKYVMTLARGGSFEGVRPEMTVVCCTDGFRPVFFKLERR